MSSLSRRLDNLEDRSREHATAEVLTAWERLTDAEVVRIVAPFCFDREPTSEEQAAHETFQEEVSEDLIARAIGLRAEIDEGEIDRRIGGLVALVQERRRARVTRMLTDYEKGVRR